MASSASSLSPSPWKTIQRKISQHQMIVQSVSRIADTFLQLSRVKSCAMLGCGSGHLDLEFASRYLPNIEKLTAVEPDVNQMAVLKTSVAQLLPDVCAEFYQETVQNWTGSDQPFDAVLLFHVLYYIPESERPELFMKLFDKVVANGGFVFIVTAPCNIQKNTRAHKLKDLLSLTSYDFFHSADAIQVCDMMTSAGFHDCYQLPIEYQIDVKEESDEEDLISILEFWSRGMISHETIREAIREVSGSEKCIQTDVWFGMFKKP